MKCSVCGKKAPAGICDACNKKIAEEMAKRLRKELEEMKKEEGKRR